MNRFIWPLLQHVNIWLLAATIISILFFFFAMRVRFAKHPSVKSYSLFFYAFIFYAIAAISFVVLNAMNSFLNINDGFYSEVWWFLPINILAAITGYLIALIIHTSAVKVAEPYTYKLMNSSLLIISLALIFTLLVQPIQTTFDRVLSYNTPPPKPKSINLAAVEEVQIDSVFTSVEGIPSQIFDSIQISYSNQKLKFINPANGFSFNSKLLIQPIEQIYVLPITSFKYLAVLALAPRIQAQSELLLIDSMGTCVFNQSYSKYFNVISLNANNSQLQINERNLEDSVLLGLTYQLR